jgi:tubby and related proteins
MEEPPRCICDNTNLTPVFNFLCNAQEGDRFLLASKKRPNNKTSNYLISMCKSPHASRSRNQVCFTINLFALRDATLIPSEADHDLNRTSSNYVGKLRSNFVGTEFQVRAV